MIGIVTYTLSGRWNCPAGELKPSRVVTQFDCETGQIYGVSCTLTTDQWLAFGGYPVGLEPCESSPPGPVVAVTCFPEEQPKQCPAGSYRANVSPAGLLGDPVDLTSGALKLTPTDVDLGGGLRFARHYASTRTVTGPMGRAWRHSLDWALFRGSAYSGTPAPGYLPVFTIRRPFRTSVGFVGSYDALSYLTAPGESGFIAIDPDGTVHYVDESGEEADFDPQSRLVALRTPGEPPIAVSYGTDTATYSNGTQTLVVTTYPSGHTNAGRIASVSAGGETWLYGYDASQNLTSIEGPDLSTQAPSDRVTWTYVYTTPVSSGLVTRLDRTAGGVTTTVASWTHSGGRVVAVDEPALEQPLTLSYTVPETNRLKATVKNASNQTLAVFDSTNNLLFDVSNPSGPAAPVAGGPGVPVSFTAATVDPLMKNRWHTQTDANGNVTLYDAHDAKGRPGRIVEGWIDGATSPGVFSADDTYTRRRETTYHPVLDEPLTRTETSAVTGVFGDKVTIYDYDDPLDPGDNPAIPNENPTNLLFAKIEQGKTLDANGAVVPVTATTRYSYDTDGRRTSESGPRPESYTEYAYQPGTGYRTAVRRYLNGPASSYLETTFSDFDARGNPQTVTDPNGRVTLFTYDGEGRVKTTSSGRMTPPSAATSKRTRSGSSVGSTSTSTQTATRRMPSTPTASTRRCRYSSPSGTS